MYNRYDGNTGRFVRMPEPQPQPHSRPSALRNPPPPPVTYTPRPAQRPIKQGPPPARGRGLGDFLPNDITGIFNKLVPNVFILYLMYRESGDKELLIVLGAMLFL